MPIAQIFDLKKDVRFQQGIEQGIEQVIEQGKINIIESWILEGKLSDETMANLLHVSLDFVLTIRAEIAAQKNGHSKK